MKNESKTHEASPSHSDETNAAANEPANIEGAIAVEAYLLWEAAGCPEGCAEEFWFAAAGSLGNSGQP